MHTVVGSMTPLTMKKKSYYHQHTVIMGGALNAVKWKKNSHTKLGCVCVCVFPQVSAPSSVPGQTVARSSPDQTSWRVTTAHTRARSDSTARCVTSASWGATTWLNMPGDTQASIPACSRAPARPRDAAAQCPCPPLTLETRALLGCEAHPHAVHINIQVHIVDPEAYAYIDAPTCVVFTFTKILSGQTLQPARPLFKTFFYAWNIVQQPTETYLWAWL